MSIVWTTHLQSIMRTVHGYYFISHSSVCLLCADVKLSLHVLVVMSVPCVLGMYNQLAKIHNSLLDTTHSARNLGFISDEHLTFADQITALSKACYLLSHSSTLLYPAFVNCLYHCYLYRLLQT